MVVRLVQARVAGEQLGYTYTPAEQKRATTPKPPRTLARPATRGSLSASLSFGRLWGGERVYDMAAGHVRGKIKGQGECWQEEEGGDVWEEARGDEGGEGGECVVECLWSRQRCSRQSRDNYSPLLVGSRP